MQSTVPARPGRTRSPVGSGPSADFERECCGLFAEAVQMFGVPKSIGQIYGLLYASPRPLTFSDIVARLGISKGSASQGLQLLRSLRAIRVIRGPADSRDDDDVPEADAGGSAASSRGIAYEPELSLRKLVSGVLHERVGPFAARSSERLALLQVLAEHPDGERSFRRARLRQLDTWKRRLRRALPLLGVLLGPKNGP